MKVKFFTSEYLNRKFILRKALVKKNHFQHFNIITSIYTNTHLKSALCKTYGLKPPLS